MGPVQKLATFQGLQIDGDIGPCARPGRLMIVARKKSSECVFFAQHRFIPWSVSCGLIAACSQEKGLVVIWRLFVSTAQPEEKKMAR
jgi:hypothetical protein